MCLSLALVGTPAWAGQAGPAGQAGQASGQAPPPRATSQTQTPPPPDNLDRIREAVNRPAAIKIENGQRQIYVQIVAQWPSFAEMTKGYDLMNGPTGRSRNAMSHQEFLDMVTPRDMYSTVGINPAELLTSAVVTYFGVAAITKSLAALRHARSEKEMRDIQAQIDRELAALRGGG